MTPPPDHPSLEAVLGRTWRVFLVMLGHTLSLVIVIAGMWVVEQAMAWAFGGHQILLFTVVPLSSVFHGIDPILIAIFGFDAIRDTIRALRGH